MNEVVEERKRVINLFVELLGFSDWEALEDETKSGLTDFDLQELTELKKKLGKW